MLYRVVWIPREIAFSSRSKLPKRCSDLRHVRSTFLKVSNMHRRQWISPLSFGRCSCLMTSVFFGLVFEMTCPGHKMSAYLYPSLSSLGLLPFSQHPCGSGWIFSSWSFGAALFVFLFPRTIKSSCTANTLGRPASAVSTLLWNSSGVCACIRALRCSSSSAPRVFVLFPFSHQLLFLELLSLLSLVLFLYPWM